MSNNNSGKDAKKDKTAQNDKDKFKTAPRLGGTSHKSKGGSGSSFALELENLERTGFSEAVGGKSGSSSDSRRADRISTEEKKKKGSSNNNNNGEDKEGDIVSPRGDKKDKKGASSRKKEKDKKDRDSKKGKSSSSKDKKDLAKRHSAEVYSDTLLQAEKSPRSKFFGKRGTDDKDKDEKEKDKGEKKDKKNGNSKDAAAKKKTPEPVPKSQNDKKGTAASNSNTGTAGGKEDPAARRGKKEGVLVARPARKDELFKKQIEEQLKRSLTPGDKPPVSGFRKVGTGEEVEEWDPDKKIHILRTPTLEADPSLEAFNHCGEKP